jgi:cytochrome P450
MPQLFGLPKVDIRGQRALTPFGRIRRAYGFLDDPVGVVLGLRPRGDVVALIDRSPAIVCVFGVDRNRDVLANPSLFEHDASVFEGPSGSAMSAFHQCLVGANGSNHRRLRALLQPAFSKGALEGYAGEIASLAKRGLDELPREGAVDVSELCRDLALEVALKCFYGLQGEAAKKGVGRLIAEFIDAWTNPMAMLLPINVSGFPYRKKLHRAELLAAALRSLIASKRTSGGNQRDALGLLLAARDGGGEQLTDDELMAEAFELVVAGHETTALTLTWTLLLLDQHPEVLANLRDELAGLGDRADAVGGLPLLDSVVKESMRLLPPAPLLFPRTSTAETTLGDHRLPAGATVVVSPVATHHDPTLYSEPRRFLPERWRGRSVSPYAYLPFGAGPRTCIGMVFAAQAIRLLLAAILRRRQFRCEPGTVVSRITRGNIMRPRFGLPMRMASPSAALAPARRPSGDIHELVDFASEGGANAPVPRRRSSPRHQ